MSDIYSFYQLISKYQIEIPIIQRDYAQGRNNSKAADVRKSLVDNMIKAVKEEKSLFFDFVYGRVDNNKFIPFDGQQRLTTLFLFHKYVFEKCQSDSGCNHKDNCSCGGILGRFSYATRQSSREFCKKLVENDIIPDDKYKNQLRETFIAALKKEDNEKEKKADEFIKSIDNWIYRFVTNQPWFYPDWEKDPTVMGMLTMLDEIHCQMRNETDFKTFAERLTSGCNCPITFHFVDMGEHKMSDETYVKMNARGKTLTPFENFKASLEQYLEGNKMQDLQNRLKNKIDGDWLDLFWKINGNVLPDTLMMSFFNRHFMNVWRCWYENNSKTEKERKSLNDEQKKEQDEQDEFNKRIQEEMPLYPTKDNFVSFDIYEYVIGKCGVDVCLSPIFNIWDALCEKDNSILSNCQAVWNRKEEEPKWNLYQGDKNKDNRETYPSRVAFYALMRYFTNSTNTASLIQWMRVVWNIIENSTIDSSDTYHAALRLIEKLSAKSHTIYNALANEFESFELGNQYHAQEQVAEEIAKAKQILNGRTLADGKSWEDIIYEAENHAFFKGAIRFLYQGENGEDNWPNFDTKWTNAQQFFNNGVIASTIEIAKYFSDDQIKDIFSRYGFKKENWKSILLQKSIYKPIHQFLLKGVVNNTSVLYTDIENILGSIDSSYDVWLLNWPPIVLTNYRVRESKPYNRYIFQVGNVVKNEWNNIISNLREIELFIPQAWGDEKKEINGQVYYRGLWTDIKYRNHFFRYFGNNTICLMKEDWGGKKFKNENGEDIPEKPYFFEVTNCFAGTKDEEIKKANMLHFLDCLIHQAEADEQNKPCKEVCPNKINSCIYENTEH